MAKPTKPKTPAKRPARTTRARRKRATITIAESNRIFNRLKRAKPLLSCGDVERIDHELAYTPHGRNRRAALMMLTRPGKFLIDWANGDRGNALALADGVLAARDTVTQMRELADLLDVAIARMAVALCEREDMEEIYAEAQAGTGRQVDASEASHA